jgi:hypothetical protein
VPIDFLGQLSTHHLSQDRETTAWAVAAPLRNPTCRNCDRGPGCHENDGPPDRRRCRQHRACARPATHKAQLASDRMSCHSATANQVRLVLHTAAFWLMHGVLATIPPNQPARQCRVRDDPRALIKIGARVIEHIARIRVYLPTSCPEGSLFRTVAFGLMPSGP